MIKAIAHVCIATTDLAASERFYGACLGLSKTFDFIKDGQVIGHYFQINPSNFIEVFLAEAADRDRRPHIMHFCLEVEDIDKAIERLRDCGVQVTDKALGPDQTWLAWLEDPNGATIELHQYTDQSHQRLGGDCIMP